MSDIQMGGINFDYDNQIAHTYYHTGYEQGKADTIKKIGEHMRTGNVLEDIVTIVKECEEIQKSGESQHTKEQARLKAYEEIKDIFDFSFEGVANEDK